MTIPLQLKEYFFIDINIKASPPTGSDEPAHPIINSCVEIGKNEDNNIWVVNLKTILESPEGQFASYTGHVSAVGFFEVNDIQDKKKAKRIVTANGTAILYTSTRELILTLTSRGPWPSIQIPTTNFIPENKK